VCVKCETTSIKIEIHIIYEVHQEFTMAHRLGLENLFTWLTIKKKKQILKR